MSTEMVLRLFILGAVAVVVVLTLAMEQDSYSRPQPPRGEKSEQYSKPRHRRERGRPAIVMNPMQLDRSDR